MGLVFYQLCLHISTEDLLKVFNNSGCYKMGVMGYEHDIDNLKNLYQIFKDSVDASSPLASLFSFMLFPYEERKFAKQLKHDHFTILHLEEKYYEV